MIRVLDIIEDTMVDGTGLRTSIYAAGCAHRCQGCHNPQSWDFGAGRLMSTEEIMDIIKADPFADVTFSGGDPMYQADGFAELAAAIKRDTDKTIWCYTGFTFEELLADETKHRLLSLIDVLVDGPFVQEQRDLSLRFRGSRNQRLIDVPTSLEQGRVVTTTCAHL